MKYTPSALDERCGIRDYRIWDLRILLMDAMSTEGAENVKEAAVALFDELNTLTERMDVVLQQMLKLQQQRATVCEHKWVTGVAAVYCRNCSVRHV